MRRVSRNEWLELMGERLEKKSKIEKKDKITPQRVDRIRGRNEECPCGSGKKFKRCCLDRYEEFNKNLL